MQTVQEVGNSISKGFAGCLKDFTIEGVPMRDPVRTVDVLTCSDKVEPGVFITAKGGYVVAGKFRINIPKYDKQYSRFFV